ncbi:hypothetical protein [Kitasatospora sp. NPDC090308]|uniref:hypothetical protein n=1 Tax=Kitasatospora sp. NPDC090308 TaxID=3364082 RepID=UPI00381F3490
MTDLQGAPWRELFTPGERLGWTFTDLSRLRRPFPDPEPAPPDRSGTAPDIPEGVQLPPWKRTFDILLQTAGATVLGTAAGLPLSAWHTLRTGGPLEPAALFGGATVVGVAAGALWCLLLAAHRALLRAFRAWRRRVHRQRLRTARDAWQHRRDAHELAERERLSTVEEWRPAKVPESWRRIDVVGGNLWGWEAFLTVFGCSTLAGRGPATVLDLSGELVVRELARGAAESGLTVDVQLLPAELAGSDLLTGLAVPALVEVFVESLHGGGAEAGRAERATDTRLLTAVCEVLAVGGLSMARIAAGLRVLLGEPAGPADPAGSDALSAAERAFLADELFSADYRAGAADGLRRIEALAHALGPLGTRRTPRAPAALRCVALSTEWHSGSADFLADLVVAWAARRVAGGPAESATLIVAGADGLAARHLERLTDLCERRGVRLVVMFRHLREVSAGLLGAGPVAFMRLGNHEEAARAADFIGREHRIELSQLTETLGGSETHSTTVTDGGSDGGGLTTSRSRSGGPPGSASWSRSDTHAWNVSRTWGSTLGQADGTSWSTTRTGQRVHEHTVEPGVLQRLPDYAMVLAGHGAGRRWVGAVEVNPGIALLRAARTAALARTGPAAALDPADDTVYLDAPPSVPHPLAAAARCRPDGQAGRDGTG